MKVVRVVLMTHYQTVSIMGRREGHDGAAAATAATDFEVGEQGTLEHIDLILDAIAGVREGDGS